MRCRCRRHNASPCYGSLRYVSFPNLYSAFDFFLISLLLIICFLNFRLASLIVFFLEITWAVTLFLQVCVRNEQNAVFQCWEKVLWINRWKKTVIYWSFSILLILKPHRLWLSSVAGIMLVLLGILYLVLCFGSRGRGSGKETLLHNQDDYYDRQE